MSTHPPTQGEFVCLATLGIVGVILVSALTFAAYSPVFEGDILKTQDRNTLAIFVCIFHVIWGVITLNVVSAWAGTRSAPAFLAGLLGLLLALFVLLVGGGARNWPAGALLVLSLFWGGFVLELGLGLVRRLIARFVASPAPDARSGGWTPFDGGFGPGIDRPTLLGRGPGITFQVSHVDHEALSGAAAGQSPPPYGNVPSLEGDDSATPLLPLRETHSVPSKPVEHE